MKKLFLAALATTILAAAQAQQKEGKIIYERTVQMQITVSGNMPAGLENALPKARTDRFELDFANNQMTWRQMEEEIQDENAAAVGGIMVVRSMGGGADDIIFCDFDKSRRTEQREFFDKKFLVQDTLLKGNWKITGETKTILNHLCRQATTQRIGKRMTMSMTDGKMERKEMPDTSTIVAWFTTDIPVPGGPEMQGQLPGMILELESNNGRTVYKALELTAKPTLSAIKEPTKGKKVTQAEFTAERNKLVEQMQHNNGGQMRFRMN